jgi:hypothetical protein
MPSKLPSSTRQTKQVPSCPVADKLTRRSERLLERRRKQAPFRDLHKTLITSTSTSPENEWQLGLRHGPPMASPPGHEDALFLGPPALHLAGTPELTRYRRCSDGFLNRQMYLTWNHNMLRFMHLALHRNVPGAD